MRGLGGHMAPDKVARRLAAIVAVDAMRWAVEMQRTMAERKADVAGEDCIRYRVGNFH